MIYVHIPFCVKKCGYCDFYSITDFDSVEKYIDTLIFEIREFYNNYGVIRADTVYFGGGTPSAVPAKYIKKILNELEFSSDAELTIELNPKTFDSEKLKVYRDSGINRVSVGLQSANNDELEILGRIHTFSDFLSSFDLVRTAGFDNVNVDIMYGLPFSNNKKLSKTLDESLKLGSEHISAYSLTLAENTPIYNMDYSYPSDDGIFSQYELVNEKLAGFYHYEISNYAKSEEYVSKHNLKYWKREKYVGFGAGAHSFFDGKRYENVSDIKKYLNNEGKINIYTPADKDVFIEYIMLSLRLKDGIDIEFMKKKLNFDFYGVFRKKIDIYINLGYMNFKNNRIFLTEKGFFVSNAIISTFLPENI